MRLRFALAACLLTACTPASSVTRVQVAAVATALDANTVEIRFTEALDPASVDPGSVRVFAPLDRPVTDLVVREVTATDGGLIVTTADQVGGALYSVSFGALRFVGIDQADAPSQVNFHGYGRARVIISVNTAGYVAPERLSALVTVDPATGEFSEALRSVPMTLTGPDVFSVSVDVRIEPDRTHAVRAVGPNGDEAAQLATFRVISADEVHVGLTPVLPELPEFMPPVDPTPGDGFAPVRIILDDRLGRALTSPELRSSLDASGRFDGSASRLDRLTRVPDKGRVYELLLNVEVDPNRRLDGQTQDDFPYVVFLVEGGDDFPQRGTTFALATEEPRIIIIPIGNPALVPVTFRVDAGESFVEPDGSVRAHFEGEGIFLTGEMPSSEDALGRLAADAFSGGERATLQMKERPDAPGIFEKTIFMPPNRPYGWKVVRCPSGVGCAELNRRVISSGRAFPTVMKNLVTASTDAANNPSVRLVDPANLDRVELEDGQTVSYVGARVSLDGSESPSSAIMFKQEAPDLVVTVAREPVITPIVVVGTWRDINIPERPIDIIAAGGTLELTPFDYDDGTQGRYPLIRDRELPLDPMEGGMPTRPGEPPFDATNGARDPSASSVLSGTPSLFMAWNERQLYFATEPASPGHDRFVLVSFDPPGGTARGAHWAKSGQITAGARQMFLGNEGDGGFVGWFRWGASTDADELIMGGAVQSSAGAVLEASLDPVGAGVGALGDRVWVAVLEYATADGGALLAQSPAGNQNLDVEAAEFHEVLLSNIRAR